jgi:hypothetical protein
MSKEIHKDPLPAAVVLRRPPRGPTTRGCPHWGRGVGAVQAFSQAPAEPSPLMTNSRLIRCHARAFSNPHQNEKAPWIARSSSNHTAKGPGFSG